MDAATIADAGFYAGLPVQNSFRELADGAAYRPLPEGWSVGTADIVGSTQHIEAGRYKMVNTVGAAVIAAEMNAVGGKPFPFVFGGDGASFAFPDSWMDAVRDALAKVIRWAEEEFGMEMRAAIVPVADIRAAGFDVAVARYGAAKAAYAMFSGGGVAWAERQMKAGRYRIDAAPPGAFPDLSGLSCRWTPMRSKHGKILSVLIVPKPDAARAEVEAVMRRVLDVTHRLERDGHPVPSEGPGTGWPPAGLALEAHATRRGASLALRKAALYVNTLFAYLIFRFNLRVGKFDPTRYKRETTGNADFRKFDDGLKMTLDSDAETRRQIEAVLKAASDAGILSYGLFEQDEAIMTCIVPSLTEENHIHFVDGAAGGYTTAAMAIK